MEEVGKGGGIATAALDPFPRNFANPQLDKMRTPGEKM